MKPRLIKCIGAVIACGMISAAEAGTFTDNFNVSRDYLTQGVAGSTYHGFTAGEINPGIVSAWNANITAANTLTITNANGAWRNTGDGPFFWQMVNGDFTNTVKLVDMSQLNYHFAGLMVRNPSTNSGQNYVSVAMFAEFNVGIVWRNTLDSSDSDNGYTPAYFIQDDKSTWPKWLQITRVGTMITLNVSADGTNWELVTQQDRPDFPANVQVGIYDSTFTANVNYAQFQSFKIEGPNVGATPPAVASGLTITPISKSLNISWTPGAGSAGSVVVARRGLPITRQPSNGTNYLGDAIFGNGNDLGDSNYVVYAGSGSSVTITNVTPAVPYNVAVYAYSGSGASTVYAVSNAPSATDSPLGNPIGIIISYGATNAVAVDDTVQAMAFLHFDSGDFVQLNSGVTFSSGTPSVASITTGGLASGLANGTALITANYQSFTTSSNLTVIKLPVTDDFSVARNYLTQGIAGTPWHGLLLGTNDIPVGGTTLGLGFTTVANASITTPGRLTIRSTDTGFDQAEDDGFFLYRVIKGDFRVSVQLTSFNNIAYHMPGLMARADFVSAENSLAIVGFNEFNIGNFVRVVTSGLKAEVGHQFGQSAQPFLMIERQTNTFKFYQKAHALDSWTLIWTEERADLDGLPMQVGVVDQIFTPNTGTAEFDNLLFVGSTINSPNAPATGPSNLTLSSTQSGKVSVNWTAAPGSSGSIVVAHPNSTVTRQPADGSDYSSTANADVSLAADIGGSNIVVYAGSGTSVQATGLPPYQYSFAVYSYATVGGTNYYNILSPAANSIVVLGIPVIGAQPPASITRYQGQSIAISAAASPASYRWQKGGVDVTNDVRVSGAATTSLAINSLITSDAGNYTLIATTSAGSVTSSPTALTVLVPVNTGELSVLAYGPSAFWRLNEPSGTNDIFDYVGGFNGTHGAGDVAGGTGPRPSDGFSQFETGNLSAEFAGSTGASFPGLTPSSETVSSLTVTAWIYPFALPADRAGIVSFTAPAETALRLYGGANGMSILWNNTVSHSGMLPPVGQWSFVAMVVSPSGGKIYVANTNGWQVFSDSASRAPISLSGTGYIGSDRNIAGRYFSGWIDEVAVYKTALSPVAITNLYKGIIAPPTVTLNIEKIVGGVRLTWPQGTLLEATNVSGPWTTNVATSPYTISNPAGNKFFRVRVQ